jgi:magnesium transporter
MVARRFWEGRLMKGIPKRSIKAGLAPGTLVHIGKKKTGAVKITVFEYDETHCQERQVANPEDIKVAADPAVTWVDVSGIHQLDVIERFGKQFNLHPLLLEDIVNTDQRPKLDDFGSYWYVVLKMLYAADRSEDFQVEQVSLVFGPNFLLTFQENGRDVFQPIRERLRTGKGRIRQSGSDYLLYSLVDAIVDQYFVVLEAVGERLESLQDAVVDNPRPATLHQIHALKRELLFLRRAVWPVREVINALERLDSPALRDSTKVFFRDVYDHVIQIIDTIETLREMASGMLDIYLSSTSSRLNAVIKVLTIITTIFMPLTFIVGIYGMNFEYIPELHWRWGYPLVLFVMVAIAIGMLVYFKRKKWL